MYRGSTKQWEMQKYGHLVEAIEKKVEGHFLTYKLYYYKGDYMTETWFDGCCISTKILPF